jgi:hypothetical protein
MTGYVTRRHAAALLAAMSCLVTGAAAQAQDSVKIGYAISKTGPNTGGASITTLPNYQLWVKEVNAAGGIMLGGKRVPKFPPDRLVRDVEPTLGQEFLDISIAEREPQIAPDGVPDDLGWVLVSSIGDGLHSPPYRKAS